MNTTTRPLASLALGGLCLLGLAPGMLAHEEGAYAYGDFGAAFTDDIRVREFPGAASGTKVELRTGGRFSVGGGYRFNEWLLLGGETGVIAHEIRHADASFAQVPLLANLELRLPTRSPIVPFIGGGPGVSLSVISFDHESLAGGDEVHGSDSDSVFAWQVYGGVRWKINDNMSVGVVYKYFAAGSPSWEVRHSDQEIRFGNSHTHSLSASFNINF